MTRNIETGHNQQALTLDELQALLDGFETRLSRRFDGLASHISQPVSPVAEAQFPLFAQTGSQLQRCLVTAEEVNRSLRRITDGRGADYVVIPAGRRPASHGDEHRGPGYSYKHQRYL
jgi:hypothetical protein